MKRKPYDAKLAAFRDIAEDCERENKELRIPAEFRRHNLLLKEDEICADVGIDAPDFRVFNGGHNKKSSKP